MKHKLHNLNGVRIYCADISFTLNYPCMWAHTYTCVPAWPMQTVVVCFYLLHTKLLALSAGYTTDHSLFFGVGGAGAPRLI